MTRARVTRQRDTCYRIGRSATGLGLFATTPIEPGAFIVEYSGQRIPTRAAHAATRLARPSQSLRAILFGLFDHKLGNRTAQSQPGVDVAAKVNASPEP